MENITESNRIIAEFMVEDYRDGRVVRLLEGHRCGSNPTGEVHFPIYYHTSWEWLMPVVEKINSELRQGRPEIRIGFRTEVFYSPLTKDGDTVQKLSNSYIDGSIESVYKAVVQFITWYNTNEEATK